MPFKKSTEKVIVPRNFVLLDELEQTEKATSFSEVSLGLEDKDDRYFHTWNALVVTNDNSWVREHFISFHVYCGDEYPDKPPIVNFKSKPSPKIWTVMSKYISGSDYRLNESFPTFQRWNRDMRMMNIFNDIKMMLEGYRPSS